MDICSEPGNKPAKTQDRNRYHQLSFAQIQTNSKLQNEIVGWRHVGWVAGQVGTTMMAEIVSGWSTDPGHLEPPGPGGSSRRMLKAKSSQGMH